MLELHLSQCKLVTRYLWTKRNMMILLRHFSPLILLTGVAQAETPSAAPSSLPTCNLCLSGPRFLGPPVAVVCACVHNQADPDPAGKSIDCYMNCNGDIKGPLDDNINGTGNWQICSIMSPTDVCGADTIKCTSDVEFCAFGHVEGCPDAWDDKRSLPASETDAKCLCEGQEECPSFTLEGVNPNSRGNCTVCPDGGIPQSVICGCNDGGKSIDCKMNCGGGNINEGPWTPCDTLSTADVCGDDAIDCKSSDVLFGNTFNYFTAKAVAGCLCERECPLFIPLTGVTNRATRTLKVSAFVGFFSAIIVVAPSLFHSMI